MASIAVRLSAQTGQLVDDFGKAEQLAEGFKNRLTAIGKATAQSFSGARASFNATARELGNIASVAAASTAVLSKFTKGNEEMQDRLEKMTVILAIAAPAIQGFASALRLATGPIGLVVIALGAAILVVKNWETITRAVTDVAMKAWSVFGRFLMNLWGGLGQAAQGLGQILLGALTLDVARIQDGYRQMLDGFTAVSATMVTAASSIVEGIGSVVTKLGNMAAALTGVGTEMDKLREKSIETMQEIIDASSEAAAALESRIKIHQEEIRLAEEAAILQADAAQAAVDLFGMESEAIRQSNELREESNRMAEAGIMLLDAQAKAALAAGKAIRQFNENVVATFQAAWDAVVSGVSQSIAQTIVFGGSLMEAMQSILKQVLANVIATLIQLGIQRLLTALGFIAATIKENVVRMAALTQQTFAGAFAATVAIPIIGPALAPKVAAASTAAMLAGAAGAAAAGAAAGATVGALAAGGIVTRPMMPLIGEAGPEAVIPLSGPRGRAALAELGGGEIHLSVILDERTLLAAIVPNIPGFVRVRAGIRTA